MMKQVLALALLSLSICLNAQQDIMKMIYDMNSQPERIAGYNKMVTQTYIRSYDKNAPIDTILYDSEGNSSELTLKKSLIVQFGDNSDIEYEVDMLTGDTIIIRTRSYNDAGKMITQITELGDSEAASLFNNTKKLTYDDKNRILTIKEIGVHNKGLGNISVTYHKDGLPQSLEADMGVGNMKVTRQNLDDFIKYDLVAGLSEKMGYLMNSMGKSLDDIPQLYLETRKKNNLYQTKLMKEEGQNKEVRLQSITTRDIQGKIYEIVKYQNDEITDHKKYTYSDGKLDTITDILRETTLTNEYDINGNLTVSYDDYSMSTMTYNQDGMLATKSSKGLFYNEFKGLDVVKYYK